MRYPPVFFPDAVAVVIAYLDPKTTATVAPRKPEGWRGTNPGQLVVVKRLGGAPSSVVTDVAYIGIDCYAATEEEASDLAQIMRGWVNAMTGHTSAVTTVYQVEEAAGPSLQPDPLTDTPRYRQEFQIAMRGSSEPVSA